MIKDIWHKAASPPHTDGSVVFARLRQCTPNLVHPNRHPHRGVLRTLLSRLESIDSRACPGMSWVDPFSTSKLSLHVWGSWLTWFIHSSLGPPDSTSRTAPRSVQPAVFVGLTVEADRPTDHATPSVAIICNGASNLYRASCPRNLESEARLTNQSHKQS